MSFTTVLIALVYVGTAVEARSFYPSFNDYPAVKYNDIGDGEFDEVHEVHEDHEAAVTQQHEAFSPTVLSPTGIDDDVAAAGYGRHYNSDGSGGSSSSGGASSGGYKYEYHINSPYTGDYKTQQEERVGDVVRGSYSFIESDGRKRIVEYTADPIHGFNAIVKHEPANALHLQRSINERDIANYHHRHPVRHAIEIERPQDTSPTVANLLPTLPTLLPSPSPSPPSPSPSPTSAWIVSPTPSPSAYQKKLFHAKPPPPPPPYKSNATKYVAVPDRSHLDGRPFVTWPFLYGI